MDRVKLARIARLEREIEANCRELGWASADAWRATRKLRKLLQSKPAPDPPLDPELPTHVFFITNTFDGKVDHDDYRRDEP